MSDLERIVTHFKDAIEASGNGNMWRFVRVDIIEDAVELLKKQNERIERLKYNLDALFKERSDDAFEVLDNISSAYYGKQMYFMQDNGMIYDRYNCDYITFDKAVNRFARMVADDD